MSNPMTNPVTPEPWTLEQAVALCTAIQNLPSEKFGCHPALTGGLLYKVPPRKDCDIVIYQRGDVGGVRMPIDWSGLWLALMDIGLLLVKDYGYVKKCTYYGKTVDVFDPTLEGGDYAAAEPAEVVAEVSL
jgi:hypothetical protein